MDDLKQGVWIDAKKHLPAGDEGETLYLCAYDPKYFSPHILVSTFFKDIGEFNGNPDSVLAWMKIPEFNRELL